MRLDKAKEIAGYLRKYEPYRTKINLFAPISICFSCIYPPDGVPQHNVQELHEIMMNGSTVTTNRFVELRNIFQYLNVQGQMNLYPNAISVKKSLFNVTVHFDHFYLSMSHRGRKLLGIHILLKV